MSVDFFNPAVVNGIDFTKLRVEVLEVSVHCRFKPLRWLTKPGLWTCPAVVGIDSQTCDKKVIRPCSVKTSGQNGDRNNSRCSEQYADVKKQNTTVGIFEQKITESQSKEPTVVIRHAVRWEPLTANPRKNMTGMHIQRIMLRLLHRHRHRHTDTDKDTDTDTDTKTHRHTDTGTDRQTHR